MGLERKNSRQIGRTLTGNKKRRHPAYEGKYFADHAAGGPKECREQNNDNEDPVEFSKTQGRKIHTYLTDWTLPVFKPAKPSLAFAASASLADLKGPACTR